MNMKTKMTATNVGIGAAAGFGAVGLYNVMSGKGWFTIPMLVGIGGLVALIIVRKKLAKQMEDEPQPILMPFMDE